MRRVYGIMLLATMMFALGEGTAMEAGAESTERGSIHKLPQPRLDSGTSVERALGERRSIRDFRSGPLSLADVGQLLWAAQGITSPRGLRTAPSAGALYPLEAYLVAGDVAGLPAGVYHYRPQGHALAMIRGGDQRGPLSLAALGQPSVVKAPAVVVLAAVFERTTGKYGERGVRYVHMDAGHAAENVYLQAVSLGLGTVAVGAFDDARVREVMGLRKGEVPLYLMPVGRR